jgi:nucleosome assembly protein 1-like 1
MAPIEHANGEKDVEDSPIVKELKEIDDKYLAVKKEFEQKKKELRREIAAKQKPLLETRAKMLAGDDAEGAQVSTLAIKEFWLKALTSHPASQMMIESWDAPVLGYLKDIVATDLDRENSDKGFRLDFHFASNQYFSNDVLFVEFHTKEGCVYREEVDIAEVKASTIDWKAGQDVTVEKKKAAKTKKPKQKKKSDVEPRESFFRNFFVSLKQDGSFPDSIDPEQVLMMMQSEDAEEEDVVEFFMGSMYEVGCAIREYIVPYATRWYTGEAAPEMEDDEDGESEDDDEDDDDDESSEDEKPSAAKGKAKKAAVTKKNENEDTKKEECKQQ